MSDAAPSARYRIGELARLAGPAVSTLRTWQERYPGLLRPTRTPGGHRVYDDVDLTAVRTMQRLVAGGSTVSAAAAHVIAERDGRASRDRRGAGGARSSAIGAPATVHPAPEPPASGRARTWWAVTATEELGALSAAHEATRAFLHAASPAEVAAAVARFVDQVGGSVRPAEEGGTSAVPLDLSLGVGGPVLAHAAVHSPARRHLEALLPVLVEDARLAASRLRAQHRRRPGGSGRARRG